MSVVIFIVMLLVLIVGHEFGHLVAAKRANMKVLEFGVGFPPKLWGRKVGDTEYTVNALPFGGFVRIFGEDEVEASTDSGAFSNRPRIAQALVIAAGPLANLVLAFVLSSVAFLAGVPAAITEATAPYAMDAKVLVVEVVDESPADLAGLLPGDAIISLTAGDEMFVIDKPEALSSAVETSAGDVTVNILRDNAELSLTVTPSTNVISEEPERRALGLASVLAGTVSLPPHLALTYGFTDTINDTKLVFMGLMTLLGSAFTLSADVSTLSGPVGIASLAGDAAGIGLGSILAFAAIISVNLAIINFLPFPALDGGRLALLGVESITRKRVPARIASGINAVGFVLLIILMIVVTVNDVFRLVA
jgi:regulator of sigma E protease